MTKCTEYRCAWCRDAGGELCDYHREMTKRPATPLTRDVEITFTVGDRCDEVETVYVEPQPGFNTLVYRIVERPEEWDALFPPQENKAG